MRVILIRHGQTEWNLQHRIQGWMDSPLTPEAIKITEDMDVCHCDKPIIYTSDLGRAQQTAEIVANKYNGRIIADNRLRERCFGILEGCVIDQDPELHYEWLDYHSRYQAKMDSIYAAESETDFEKRIRSFIEILSAQSGQSDVIIISHGEWLRAFHNIIHHQPSWYEGQGIVDNAMPTELIWHELSEVKDLVCHQPALAC